MLSKRLFGASILLLLFAGNSVADRFGASHFCSAPSIPYRFNSEYELDSFKRDVQAYRRCISDFAEEQRQAVRRHEQAASDAIDDWNRFAARLK